MNGALFGAVHKQSEPHLSKNKRNSGVRRGRERYAKIKFWVGSNAGRVGPVEVLKLRPVQTSLSDVINPYM
jgi:hypothetical protein